MDPTPEIVFSFLYGQYFDVCRMFCARGTLISMELGNWAQILVFRIWYTKVFLQQTMKASERQAMD